MKIIYGVLFSILFQVSSWQTKLIFLLINKSLTQHAPTISNPVNGWMKTKREVTYGEIGLFEAHRIVRQRNDLRCHGLFCDKIAALWEELDEQLSQKNGTLDWYLDLLNQSDGLAGTLSKDFD